MKQLIGWLGRGISFCIYQAPRFVRSGLAWALCLLWFDILRIRRQVVLNNIQIAFPEMTDKQRRQMARRSLWHLGMNMVEYSFFPFLSKENIGQLFDVEGKEHIDKELAKGRGVLMLTLHMGNGDLACCALALFGFPVVMVSKFFKLKWLNDLWFGMREKLGVLFIPPRNSSYALLKGLKNKKMVIIPLDQFTGPPIGVRTTFFGKETGTAAGLSVMTERSGAPVVPIYTWRRLDGRHVLVFLPAIEVEGSAEEMTQAYNAVLEEIIRLHPEQWMWLHRRWKRFVVH